MSKLMKVSFKLLDLLVIFMMTFGSAMPALAAPGAIPPPPSTPFIFNPDSGGQNDIDPSSLNNQSDLSAYGVNGTGAAGTTTEYGWKWDEPGLAGNNSQDVCVYLRSTASSGPLTKADYAVCYDVITDAQGVPSVTSVTYWSCPTYSDADAANGGQKCFGNSSPTSPGLIEATYAFTPHVAAQFSTDPDKDTQVILDVYSATLSFTLINICTKKSASPASDSSDCGLERAPAFLKLVKVVQDGTALPQDWTLSWDGPSTNDGSVLGNNTQFVPVPDGTYALSESSVPNYEFVSLVCSPTANSGNSVTLAQGVQETCTFTNKLSVVAPAPRVIKGNAEGNDTVATLNEPGGSVTINVVVYNDAAAGVGDATLTSLTDDIYGDITTTGHNGITATTCATGGTIAGGGSYSCSFTVDVTGEPQTVTDTLTATLKNNHSAVADTDQANVVIADVKPAITLTKVVSPSTLPEPGGAFNYTYTIHNGSTESVKLTKVTDDVLGTIYEWKVGDPEIWIAAGSDYLVPGTFTKTYTGVGSYTNIAWAYAVDNDGNEAKDDDTKTVTVTDVLPEITVTKTGNPTSVPETGGNVTFTYEVQNTSTVTVWITSLSDDPFGTLAGDTDCQVGTELVAGASCSFDATFTIQAGAAGSTHVNIFTAHAEDAEKNDTSDTDDETITRTDVLPVISVTKTASPLTMAEPGGEFTFTYIVTNDGLVPVTVTNVTDSVIGPITLPTDVYLLPGESTVAMSGVWTYTDTGTYGNTVTVIAEDDDGNTDTATATAEVTVTDTPPAILVTKTANPTHVPETGGDVTFTFLVENIGVEDVTLTSLSDTVFGDLNGQGDCVTGGTIAVGGSYSCSITVFLSSDSLTAHYNVVTAVGTDDDGTTDEATDDETVTFDDIKPDITITKTASPTHVPETGGDVTFTFFIENVGVEDVTITTLSDDVFGNLLGQGTCAATITIAAGDSYTCSITKWLASDSLTAHTNVVTAVGTDDDGSTDTATDDETVTFDDVAPMIRITKTADPTHVLETGGNVTFTFLVENIGAEDVTLTSLTDTVFGDLDGKGTCDVPQTILISGSYSCTYTVFLASDSLTAHHNVATATAVDDDNTPVTDDDDETVTFDDVLPDISITKTANPTHVPETGGDVIFTFLVNNIGVEDVTLTSLSDTVFGDLNGQGDCVTGGLIAVGGSYSCSITKFLAADDLVDHYNVVTAVGTDDDGSTDTATDDETVTFDDVAPMIRVTKTADPTHVPETGADVTFTFLVENIGTEDVTLTSLTDTVFGDLNGQGDCVTGGLIPVGGEYSCSVTVFLSSDSLTAHYNVVTAVGTDDDGTTDTATDDETVTFDDVLPDITVLKTANPTSVPETGGWVDFTFKVTNNGPEAATISSLSDSVFGTLAGDADCQVGTVLAYDAFCEFTITRWVAGDFSGDDHFNTFTGKATDNDGNEDTATDDETVTFTDVLPDISVTKTASPTYVIVPGGNVTFTFTVKNNSLENATITALSDDKFGTLAGDADCQIGTVLSYNETCTFTATFPVTGTVAGQHTNTFSATATDGDGNNDTATDDATVDILATTSKIAPTQTTCQQYRDGTAMDYTELFYNVSKGKIGSVSPGVIFFWSTITAPSASFSLEGHQFNDSGTLKWKDMANLDVFLWDATCTKVQTVTLTTASDGHPVLEVTGATAGATYYFSVKYDTGSITGTSVKKPYPTVNYTFETFLDGSLIITSPDSVAVKPKK